MRTFYRVLIIGSLFSLGWGIAHAEVSHEQIALAVLGEALHDKESMDYMAHAVINRVRQMGDLRGVYGYKVASKRVYSQKSLEMAKKAVSEALASRDITHNATHWLSDYDLTHCKPSLMAWRFSMVETAYQGQTHYYAER